MSFSTPCFDKDALKKAKVITQGLLASLGAACGQNCVPRR